MVVKVLVSNCHNSYNLLGIVMCLVTIIILIFEIPFNMSWLPFINGLMTLYMNPSSLRP